MNYLYTGNKRAEFDYFWAQKYIKSEPLKVEEIANGVVVPTGHKITAGVYDVSGRFVPLAAERWTSKDTMPNDLNSDYVDEDVVYFASFSTGHYGDVLIDDLSRLWYVIQQDSSKKLVYVTNKSQDVAKQEWCLRILSYLGISSDRLLNIHMPTRFKNVILPQKSMIHDAYIHHSYLDVYEHIWLNCSCLENKWGGVKRIYLTRRKLKRKKEIGETIFEEFFKINGFEVIAPEQLSFEEQVVLFHNCEEVASIEGTHAHNIVFKGISGCHYKQIILRKQSECIPRQIQLNRITNGDVSFIDVWKEPFRGFPISHDRGPFLIEWNENIEQYAIDYGMEIPTNPYKNKWKNRINYTIKCVLYFTKHQIKKAYLCLKH